MDKLKIAKIIENIPGQPFIALDAPMKDYTSFKLGGPADLLVMPASVESLCQVVKLCLSEGIPFLVMGNGSNIIVRDKGIRGVVIRICENMNHVTLNGEVMEVEAGALLSKIAKIALAANLSGLEFASGIPGTLGGAIAMNAGAYGGEMKDVVVRTEFIDRHGELRVLHGEEHDFGYRASAIQKEGGIVTKSALMLQKGNYESIRALMDDLNKRRKEKQPLHLPSAGSVFKRPPGSFAGKLIEDAGLRGFRMGGAQVSELHCGFIVNTGGATAEDVLSLMEHIQHEVMQKFNIMLQPEVGVVGED